MTFKLRYRNSYPGFDNPEFMYTELVKEISASDVELVYSKDAFVDLELVSVVNFRSVKDRIQYRLHRAAASKLRLKPPLDPRNELENPSADRAFAKKSIWYTGENVRPPHGDWDGYLSFDLDPMAGKNAYLPIWWNFLDIIPGRSVKPDYVDKSVTINALMTARAESNLLASGRKKFCCVFMNNPHPMRLHTIDALSAIGKVDGFGRYFGNPVPDKLAIAEEYRFILCFENDLYPGYVTEKPVESWMTGAIPLWWGDDSAKYLNSNAMLNLKEFEKIDHFVSKVAEVDSDESLWLKIASEPLLLRPPDMQPVRDLIRQVITSN